MEVEVVVEVSAKELGMDKATTERIVRLNRLSVLIVMRRLFFIYMAFYITIVAQTNQISRLCLYAADRISGIISGSNVATKSIFIMLKDKSISS